VLHNDTGKKRTTVLITNRIPARKNRTKQDEGKQRQNKITKQHNTTEQNKTKQNRIN
jgi:hypothetical protein